MTKVDVINNSTEYSYNALEVLKSLKRMGHNIPLTTAGGGYGVLDDLTYSWDGAQLQSVTAQANGSDYYGRTGFPLSATGGTADFEFDDAGQMTKDTSRQISNITYNRQGLPTRVTFSDGSKVDYVYSFSGELKSMKAYSKPVNAQGVTQITAMRDYCGDFIFEDNALSMVNFPGGYFDSEGNPNYRHTDWQGNVTIVTNSEGKIAQHSGYYPYGEPWSEPAGQPYLYGGKERLREGALNEYDFGARRYNSALALWTTPDPLAVVLDAINPYVYCASNPIRYVDPSGCEIIDHKDMLKDYVRYLENLLVTLKEFKELDPEIKRNFTSFCKSQLSQIKELSESQIKYQIGEAKNGVSETAFDVASGHVLVTIDTSGSQTRSVLGHELQHAYQFEIGQLSLPISDSGLSTATLYDINDEVDAYRVSQILEVGKLYFTNPDDKSVQYNTSKTPQWLPNRMSKKDVKQISTDYENLPDKDLRIKRGKNNKLMEVLRNNYRNNKEMYNIYRFGK